MAKKQVLILTPVILLLAASVILYSYRGPIFGKILESSLLRAGKPLKFGSYTVLIERIEGNKLFGVRITSNNRKLEAKSGEYEYIPEQNILRFKLIDGFAEDANPNNPNEYRTLTFKQSYIKVNLRSF